jgi:3-phenylpropionate/trans-cinnamate dioxygenase ferredoxin reductase subunit
MQQSVVIIGTGLAGLTVADTLRSEGHTGAITMVGAEAVDPYHRPPLSKGFLLGTTGEAQLAMRPRGAIEKKDIRILQNVSATAIDRETRQVHLSDASRLPYDRLALCTGSRARTILVPGTDLPGVHTLRTMEDAKAIGDALDATTNVVVVGGGFIGLEVASVVRAKGKNVTVIEGMDRLMARVMGKEISQYFLELHQARGASVVTSAAVVEMEEQGGRVSAVRTADGTRFPADLVLVGIGVIANAELAQSAGLEVHGGIVVDDCSRTADPRIVAAGDCTVRRLDNGDFRWLESINNAVEQGRSAACAILDKARPFLSAPWFYSDQYDIKLQMVGLSQGSDRTVVRGSIADNKFSVFYFRRDQLIAVDTVSYPVEHILLRKLFDRQKLPTPDQAGDTNFDLKSLLV